jgi:hypothetical protein
MPSVVARAKRDLEEQGDYVVMANISSGWFALFPNTWAARVGTAQRLGRQGPDLIVYRTKSANARDHHVIPFHVIKLLLVEETIAKQKNGSKRWNLTLRDHRLRVTHRHGTIPVQEFFGGTLSNEDLDIALPEEVRPLQIYREGSVRQIQVNAYERDRDARKKCIEHYGRRCSVCQMSFSEVYGPDAAWIIHVHHLVPISTVRTEYAVDPVSDLRPVCPNCHAVIHSRQDPYTLEELVDMLKRTKESLHLHE